jgi:hypothetical protein
MREQEQAKELVQLRTQAEAQPAVSRHAASETAAAFLPTSRTRTSGLSPR